MVHQGLITFWYEADSKYEEKLEIVMNEMRKFKMSADFFANTSHDICRCPGV